MSEEKTTKKSDAGKGDLPRPFSIPLSEFAQRWELAFGRNKVKGRKCHKSKEKTMAISVTGKKVTVKRLADMVTVDNQGRVTNAAYKYNYLRVQFKDGEEKQMLFTDNTIANAVKRASKNPEDCPQTTWLRDVLDTELLDGERLGDLQEVMNQKKLPAAAMKYNHVRANFDGEDIHMLFTDNEIKVALKRAEKNPEDLPKTGWLKDILD